MNSVLIIEDYQSIQTLYANAFAEAGFTVETAHSGAEGLEKVRGHEYTVIILDMLMLELSGTDFLKGFKAATHPTTKVIVVSNLDSPKVVEKAKELGAVEYLIKSQYTPKQLVETAQAFIKAP